MAGFSLEIKRGGGRLVSPFVPPATTLVSFLVGCLGSTWDMFLRFLLVSWYIVLIVLLKLFLQFFNHHS